MVWEAAARQPASQEMDRKSLRVSLQPQGVSSHKQTGCPQACAPKIMLSASARLCEAPPAWLAVVYWQSVSVPGAGLRAKVFPLPPGSV